MRILATLSFVVSAVALSGCPFRVDTIAVSNTSIDFGRNTLPFTMFVWNSNPGGDRLEIEIDANQPWIIVDPGSVQSDAPPAADGPFDEQAVRISIDRQRLPAGTFEGEVTFRARFAAPVRVGVRVVQDTGGDLAAFQIVEPQVSFSEPYVIEFAFQLRDDTGNGVVAPLDAFQLLAFEGAAPVPPETGLHLLRERRMLRVAFLFDYSLALQNTPASILAQEDAALDVLLPALIDDATLALAEFHRDDIDGATVVRNFSLDRLATRDAVTNIQRDFVQGFASGSRLWDAVSDTARLFGDAMDMTEERVLVVFSNGIDTSSFDNLNDAARAANRRGVRVLTVGVGATIDENALQTIAAQTSGAYRPVAQVGQLAQRLIQLGNDVDASYRVRWASLQRSDERFTPAFSLALGALSDAVSSDDRFRPSDFAADPLRGIFRVTALDIDGRRTASFRADYTPRQITALRLFAGTDLRLRTVDVVPVEEGGILDGWLLDVDRVDDPDGFWLELESPGPPLAFATTGPALRFEFDAPANADDLTFDQFFVDNSLYTQRQSFDIRGFPNDPPS